MAKGANTQLIKRCVAIGIIVIVLGFGSAILRIVSLGVVHGEELQTKAVEQQLVDTAITARRGTIYDANMNTLAQSATVWKVVLAPINFENDEEREIVAKGLAEILDLDEEEVFEKTQEQSYYAVIKNQIESDVRAEVLLFEEEIADKNDITGVIDLLEDYKRYYPYSTLASSVLGFTGSDDQGLAGIEYQYNDELTGTPGRLVEAKNANGTEMPYPYEQKVDAEDGNSLVLTIDLTLQHLVEKYLDEYNEMHKVYNRSVGIMMDVNTGAILAMASQGGFDCNDPFTIADEEEVKRIDALPSEEQAEAENNALQKQWRNKAISDTYYPGSVWKIMTSAMALEEGLVKDDSTYYCTGSYVPYEGAIALGCHDKEGHGVQTFDEAVCNSCNPAFMQIGNQLGEEKFWEYYQTFGFSEKTGIDLPGEATDIFFSDDGSMTQMDLAVASFGQNFSVTPIQMITSISAIANGGDLLQPYLVSQILDKDLNVIKSTETIEQREVVSTTTSDRINEVLEKNVVEGSGQNAYVQGYRIGGKTGTTEKKFDANDDGEDDYIASFGGYAPANDPQIALLVFFDTPTDGIYYGSQVAAPCFADIMEEALPYLEIETQYNEDELSKIDKIAGNYTGLSVDEAIADVTADGFTPIVKGDGDKIVSQNPPANDRIPQDGTLVLYTDTTSSDSDKVTVPNLIGLSLTDVNYVASQYGLNISVSGAVEDDTGISTSQSISEGTQVNTGTVIQVSFVSDDNYGSQVL